MFENASLALILPSILDFATYLGSSCKMMLIWITLIIWLVQTQLLSDFVVLPSANTLSPSRLRFQYPITHNDCRCSMSLLLLFSTCSST